jgi:hypothetical protein|eukprot:COSAG01_NODE_21323_length_907_cov_1.409653_2_plen_43_part_00
MVGAVPGGVYRLSLIDCVVVLVVLWMMASLMHSVATSINARA